MHFFGFEPVEFWGYLRECRKHNYGAGPGLGREGLGFYRVLVVALLDNSSQGIWGYS